MHFQVNKSKNIVLGGDAGVEKVQAFTTGKCSSQIRAFWTAVLNAVRKLENRTVCVYMYACTCTHSWILKIRTQHSTVELFVFHTSKFRIFTCEFIYLPLLSFSM